MHAIPRAFDQWAASSLSVHPAYAAITRALVGQFRAVGVELRVLELDANATYQRLRAGDFDVSIASSVVSDSDGSLSQYLASDGAFNWGALREPAMDDAVQALQRDGLGKSLEIPHPRVRSSPYRRRQKNSVMVASCW